MNLALWVRTGDKFGGLEKYLVLFSDLCAENNLDLFILNEIENTNPRYKDLLTQNGTKIFNIGESAKQPIKVLLRISKIIRQYKIQLFHLHFIHPVFVPFLKLMGVPLVYLTFHSGIDHDISLRTKFFRRCSSVFITRFFAVSHRVRDDEISAGVAPEKISVSYLGLPIDIIKSSIQFTEEPPPPYFNDPQVTKIITVGRFYPVKGMKYVVESAIKVIKQKPDLIWWIVGKEGPDLVYCQKLVASEHLEEKIFFLGERDDVPALMQNSSIMVMGSLSEGLPLVALEAAISGVPTIGTQIRGLDEAIVNGSTGILVERKSAQALADASLWLLEHPEQRTLMGLTAQQFVTNKFNSEKLISQLLEIYNKDYQAIVHK